MTRRVWKEVYKRPVDPTRLMLRALHGVVYVDGEIRPIRGQKVDLKREWEILDGTIRRLADVRDIVFNAKFINL